MARYQVISVQDARDRGGAFATAVAVLFPNQFQDLQGEHGVVWKRVIEAMLLWEVEGPGSPSIVTKDRVPDEIQVLLHNKAAEESAQLRARIATLETQVTALLAP